jgi:hypothetical protein
MKEIEKKQTNETDLLVVALVNKFLPPDRDDAAKAFMRFLELVQSHIPGSAPIVEGMLIVAEKTAYARTLDFHSRMREFSTNDEWRASSELAAKSAAV